MTAPCQFPGCGEGPNSPTHICWDDPHPPERDCHQYVDPISRPVEEPTSAPGGPVTGPCQYPLCGLSERDPRHSRPCENHPPNISCHPYVPAPEEPTSALGYLLWHLKAP
jgi:hypothetical protein